MKLTRKEIEYLINLIEDEEDFNQNPMGREVLAKLQVELFTRKKEKK